MVMVLGPAGVDVVVRTETVTVAAGEGEVWTDVGEKSHDTPIGRPVQLKVTVVGNELVTVKLVAVLGLPCVAVTAPGVVAKSMLPTSNCTARECVAGLSLP